jgi:photosystem II stability/assembly factor-like uncharacterized protein
MSFALATRTLKSIGIAVLLSSVTALAASVAWLPVGPDGGDARSFAADPKNPRHLYLGTTSSWLYQSQDGGATWQRLAKLSKKDDLVLDNILVDESDPKTLLVGTWVFDRPDGTLFISHDAGTSWETVKDMEGQSIRALAQAPSNPKILIAGTLKGVFRSEDSGQHWSQASPAGSMELHEVESIAIDPVDPKTIYAGTWHLPWKTTDGGVSWHNIKQGLIDDSDVFSIIIDPKQPTTVYTSACSGIYKSDNGGELYHKIQGIPATARRTRVLMQDPVNRNVVYAGTTEGLYQTSSSGANWARLTGPDVIINDVYVDPSNPKHVLLATDRGGVRLSEDAGMTFQASNTGFSQRQVAAVLADQKNPRILYAGVLNDKTYGGVFTSQDGGASWQQQSTGLNGFDVFSLAQAQDGSILAGTNHGLFRLTGNAWAEDNKVVSYVEESKTVLVKKKRVKVTKTKTVPAKDIESRVSGLDLAGPTWFAATNNGVYRSTNQGATWEVGSPQGASDFRFVNAKGSVVFAAGRQSLALSQDEGKTWTPLPLPAKLTSVQALATAEDSSLWIGGREGVFYSDDKGQTWHALDRLPASDISGLSYDPASKRVLLTSWNSTLVFAVDIADKQWKWWESGWNLHSVTLAGGRLVGASLFDGVVMQPGSEVAATAAAGR